MKISLSWLRDYLKTDQTSEQLAETLTRSGLEVKNILHHGTALSKVVVAQILESGQHPNADRLSVCKVDDGSEMPRQIVCGAKNFKVGDKVFLALPGAVLPGDIKIKVGKLRGVDSEGMMCSAKEIGLGEGTEGLHILPPETVVGMELGALFPSDEILELEITPNRPDWLGHIGVAREAAAFGAGEFLWKKPLLPSFKEEQAVTTIEALESCSFYSLQRLEGIKVGSSPAWLRQRLEAVGLRAINNIVDVANYVMLETAQPLHAFDAAKIKGTLTVRFAKESENLLALDGKKYTLTPSDLVIADLQGPQALAGIIGGMASSVTETTTSLLVESAVFDPAIIRKMVRSHGIITDASYRFERGTEAQGAMEASVQATSLITEVAGGKISGVFAAGFLPKPIIVSLRNDRCRKLLGIDSSNEQIASYLTQLGLEQTEKGWLIPSWRQDLTREVDLIEEVAKLYGIESITSRLASIPSASSPGDKTYDFIMKLRNGLTAQGFNEARTSALGSPDEERVEETLVLRNPMGEQQSVLRSTLLPGLLEALEHNVCQGAASVRMYEIGKTFHANTPRDNTEERISLGIILMGLEHSPDWRGEEQRSLDLYDMKGLIESLAPGKISYRAIDSKHSLNPSVECAEESSDAPADSSNLNQRINQPTAYSLQPTASVRPIGRMGMPLMLEILCEGKPCGVLGILAPALAREKLGSGHTHPIIVGELYCDLLEERMNMDIWKQGRALPKFPAVRRDLALLVDQSLPYASLEKVLWESEEELLQSIIPFDIFSDSTGEKVPQGKKSVAIALTFQHQELTLTAEEVSQSIERLMRRLKDILGAEIRC
ncbi:MAG: phenylalanine--tRNA ligase subunit beta [Verrucomicrobia bacterium RIFCSPHIGHO2_12_FULL_41_10]|nr:MAG: phenylalanine--tRNA ligase subunit beta [Verrucomicrobia bacterium RIFCSPHIGHO2_12_FULL_41_10]